MKHAILPSVRRILLGACGAMALGLLGLPSTAVAGTADSRLTVTATVLKHASLSILSQPPALVITAADIERGYVDVPTRAQVAVRNNSGVYLLEFSAHNQFVRQVLVHGLDTEVQMQAEGGAVRQVSNGRGMTTTILALGFRFALSADAQQGVYQWPMRLSVTPL